MTLSGACLCGQTTIEVTSEHKDQVLCHCLDCKQTSGSAYSTNIVVATSNFTIKGPTKTYQSAALSGKLVTRTFCSICGSAIAHQSQSMGENAAIQTGNFKAFATIPIAAELFIKDRWPSIPAIPGVGQFEKMPA